MSVRCGEFSEHHPPEHHHWPHCQRSALPPKTSRLNKLSFKFECKTLSVVGEYVVEMSLGRVESITTSRVDCAVCNFSFLGGVAPVLISIAGTTFSVRVILFVIRVWTCSVNSPFVHIGTGCVLSVRPSYCVFVYSLP